MKKFLIKIRDLFKRKTPLNIQIESITVPGALGLSEPEFDSLVNEMVNLVGDENRLLDFKNYIESPMFERHNMDLENPNHLVLVGYAFAAAIFVRRHVNQISAANKLLDELNGKSKITD